jgi:hypothetical protein
MEQHQDYDKIFKEIMEGIFVKLVSNKLTIDLSNTKNLPNNLARTIEKKPDFLKGICNEEGVITTGLQIDIQTLNDDDMDVRMLEYKGIFIRVNKRLPLLQIVVYIGEEDMTMKDHINTLDLTHKYHIISLKDIDANEFLNSSNPEEILLAILGKYDKSKAEDLIVRILTKLKDLVGSDLQLRKYLKQLEMLSKLRNLQAQTTKITEKMGVLYDMETDIRFLQGKEAHAKQAIIRWLELGNNDMEQIAIIMGVPVEFVKEVKKQHDKEQKELTYVKKPRNKSK